MKKILSIILVLTLAFGTVSSLSFGYNGEESTHAANPAVAMVSQAPISSSYTATGGAVTITGAYVTISCGASMVTYETDQIIDVDVVLSNVNDIYAEDFTITYDPDAIQFEYYMANNSPCEIYHIERNLGSVRFIAASKDKYSAVNGSANIISLKFRVKYKNGGSWIRAYGKVANSKGQEGSVNCYGRYIMTRAKIQDVNGTGTFTIGDLAIAASHRGDNSYIAYPFRPDVDRSYIVDDKDLRLIVSEILKS